MFDLEPKNIKAKIRQQSLTKVFTVLIFGLSILIIVSEYQKRDGSVNLNNSYK